MLMPDQLKEEILKIMAEKKRYMSVEEVLVELSKKDIRPSRPTIKKYIDELIKDGWIEEEKIKDGKKN